MTSLEEGVDMSLTTKTKFQKQGQTRHIKSSKSPRLWRLSAMVCEARSLLFPSAAFLINIEVKQEFSPWFCEKSLLSALLTSCGREGMMFHASSRQWFQSTREPRGCTSSTHRETELKLNGFRLPSQKRPLSDRTTRASGFEAEKKTERPLGTFRNWE